jgi:hypothetical protein
LRSISIIHFLLHMPNLAAAVSEAGQEPINPFIVIILLSVTLGTIGLS